MKGIYYLSQWSTGSDRWQIYTEIDHQRVMAWTGTREECERLAAVYESFGLTLRDPND